MSIPPSIGRSPGVSREGRVLFQCIVLCALALSGCNRGNPADAQSEQEAKAPAANAFCMEHGVAEAVCTKCNPKLALIFQDKGDWCAEHGFPESFCPTCRPELGGRPVLAEDDGAPPDGTKVKLISADTARLAGIETVAASQAETMNELQVLGTIAYDATKRAEVNARARGLVREIHVKVGERVEKGAPLIRIESAEIGAEQAKLIAASSRIKVAEAARERVTTLFEKGMAAQKDLQAAQLELDTALAEKAAAQAALGMVGVDPAGGSGFVLTAPLAGTCIRLTCTVGRMTSSEEVLCEIVDIQTMWAELDVPEAELLRVQPGQVALISADVLGDREFRGIIDFIAPEIDSHTRTARARVRLENPDGLLRANLFIHARILLGEKHARVLVPRGAVQAAKGTQLVFVELAPGEYEARRVGDTVRRGDLVELAKGVRPGERVVVAGSFLLKTETLKGQIGAGCCAEE